MTTEAQIATYLESLPASRRADLQSLHQRFLKLLPGEPLWFLDGRNAEGKVVSNPNIGYGTFVKTYADGSSRDFYRVGISANTGGISVYLMTFADKGYLSRTYADRLGDAQVSGYCIKFKSIRDIDLSTLDAAVQDAAALVR